VCGVSNLLLLDNYSMAGDEAEAAPAAPAEGEAPPAEGEAPPAEGEAAPAEVVEEKKPPPPKKRPEFLVHFERKKPRYYDYIGDYGYNYYSNMIRYLDTRTWYPRMMFEERGFRSSLVRKGLADTRTTDLLSDINKSLYNFQQSRKTYVWNHTQYFVLNRKKIVA